MNKGHPFFWLKAIYWQNQNCSLCVGSAGTIHTGLQLQSMLTIMQRRFCPAACPTRAPMLALLRLLFLFGLNLHRHPILIWERARMKPETSQLGVAQRMKLLSSDWNQLKTLRKVTLDRRRTNLGVQLPGGFSISPRKELLSSVPGLSTTPGKLGRNDERESFIRLATNKKKEYWNFFAYHGVHTLGYGLG